MSEALEILKSCDAFLEGHFLLSSGRHTPFHNNYRPQFYLRTMDVTGEVHLPAGVDMVMPGDHVTITVKLIYPVAINEGLRFAIREGGRTVGAGQILKIVK